ncbi:hypothetical protein FQA39_LY08816 [Lamprigera yunnana]|nr:hypothetical protein FQA39_LY08816 [Lamprigera yunnana]
MLFRWLSDRVDKTTIIALVSEFISWWASKGKVRLYVQHYKNLHEHENINVLYEQSFDINNKVNIFLILQSRLRLRQAVKEDLNIEFRRDSSRENLGSITNEISHLNQAGVGKKYPLPLYTKWSSWSRCEGCLQRRTKKCVNPKCRKSRMYEERPCPKPRCKRRRKANYDDDLKIVHVDDEMRRSGATSTRAWSRWSKWSKCNRECRTYRHRLCKKPERCKKKKRQRQGAYCYHDNTRCEEYVLSLLDTNDNRRLDTSKYEYNHSKPTRRKSEQDFNVKHKKCGRPRRKTKMLKIIGGKEAKKYKWPWHVAVINRFREVFCAGTLIAPTWVLTAGHCIRSYLRVRLNEHDLSAIDGRELEMTVQKMFLHPRFNHQTVDNDIALLRLPSAVNIPPVCLPAVQPESAEICSIMGWGKLNSSDEYGSTLLHEAQIPVVSWDTCVKSYKRYFLTSNMFCAGWVSGMADTCAGDSGGGFMCPSKEGSKHKFYSIQVDSIATSCIQLVEEQIIKYSDPKYNINDFKTGDCETMLLNQTIYYLNKSKSKWISVGLYFPFEFASVVKIFGRSKQYVIFKEEWVQFYEQLENINKYFQTFDTMWKPRQIGSKTLTFEIIEEKRILRIEDMCENEVYLGWESVSEIWSLESALSYKFTYSSGKIQFIKKKMWMLYAAQHWTKAIDLKSAVERLYEKLGALEFDADHKAIYGVEKYYTVEQCEKLRDKYKIGRKVCRQLLKGKTCSQCLVKRISDIGLEHFLDTIRKYIKDCSDSDTSSYSSDEEECKEAVEQNGKYSKTTEEE